MSRWEAGPGVEPAPPQRAIPINVFLRRHMGSPGGSMRVAALCAVTVLLLASVLLLPDPSAAAGGSAVVVVGDRAEMRSRSALRVLFGPYHSDPSSVGILDPVYARAVIADPMTGELRPYVAKGIDADGSGTFDGDEYGVFAKKPGTNATDITVYFDFNGV